MNTAAHPRTLQPKLFPMPNPLGDRIGADFFKRLPAVPGVYRFYGSDEGLLYIGQSNDLRARVGSYRHVTPERHPRRTLRLVGRITRIEWEECGTAQAAIERERVLLLELRPPFNRAGVWQGEPWWFHACEAEGALVAQITREPIEGSVGPLPSPFRYAFAALMRWTYRLLHPERGLSEYPLGLFNHTIPPAIRWIVSDPASISIWLRQWAEGGSDHLVSQFTLLVPERSQTTAEVEYWQEQLETLTKFWKKRQAGPQV